MYSDHVVQLSSMNFDKLVIDSTETWLVKFYAPWCGHCQSSAPAFSKAAKKLRGVAKLGVVNCDDHKDLARRFAIQGFPTIKLFKGEGKKHRRPSDYNSERSSQAFVEHVKYVMPSFVARVKPTGAKAFFADLSKLPHVLLFTEQAATSPLYKGMSARFKNRLAFGEVRKSDAAELIREYEVTAFPTLLGFQPGKSDSQSAIRYKGLMDPESLETFFNDFSLGINSTDVTDSPPSGEEGADRGNTVFTQPKAYSGDIFTIVGTRAYEDLCGSRRDGRMCALAFLAGGQTSEHHQMLKPVAQKYLYDNLAFAIMDANLAEAKHFAEVFGAAVTNGLVVVRPRKKKFAIMETNELSKENVISFLDKVVGGDARWKRLSKDLPKWEVEEHEPSTGDETENNSNDVRQQETRTENQCGRTQGSDRGSCGNRNYNHEDL